MVSLRQKPMKSLLKNEERIMWLLLAQSPAWKGKNKISCTQKCVNVKSKSPCQKGTFDTNASVETKMDYLNFLKKEAGEKADIK